MVHFETDERFRENSYDDQWKRMGQEGENSTVQLQHERKMNVSKPNYISIDLPFEERAISSFKIKVPKSADVLFVSFWPVGHSMSEVWLLASCDH